MKAEDIFYSFFGNNIIIGSHIEKQLNFLKENIPEDFKRREMHDLGCGDGKVTILLEKIFDPKEILAYDANKGLVERIKKKGINAKVMDFENEIPSGELAVMWGVFHHLQKQKEVLEKIKNNFDFLFFREPLIQKNSRKSIFELGEPFERSEIDQIIDETIGECQKFEYENAIFVFFKKNRK